jgi:hypothetical protein
MHARLSRNIGILLLLLCLRKCRRLLCFVLPGAAEFPPPILIHLERRSRGGARVSDAVRQRDGKQTPQKDAATTTPYTGCAALRIHGRVLLDTARLGVSLALSRRCCCYRPTATHCRCKMGSQLSSDLITHYSCRKHLSRPGHGGSF